MAVIIHRSLNPKRGTLWQGGLDDVVSPKSRFDVVILCAEEFQPDASLIVKPDVEVVHAPNDDSEAPLTRQQIVLAIGAARKVVRAYSQGKEVLISCMQGRNRSGLVTALTLHLLYGLSGNKARSFIRERVPNALTNPHFERFLAKVPARVPGREASP